MGPSTLGQYSFKSTVSLEQNDEKPDFLNVDTDSWKLKVDQKILGWAWSKMGVATLDSEIGFISRRN